ncbi:MAG: ABC transporter permease [Flavobacteriales bacterium]|nr:ABC transporter permease [Flavobacteriales bacterium]MCB9447528.1 ABC transporter permease [Flavobacteriales bacterium]
MKEQHAHAWTVEIKPQSAWFNLNLRRIWQYRDLLALFVKRDFIAQYKQTILGPLWFLIQPMLTTIVFTVIFGNVAKISTDGLPPLAFYLVGITGWNYFADCISKTSNTFTSNARIFEKVYFPRIIVPLSVVTSSLIRFSIQLLLLIGTIAYYVVKGRLEVPGLQVLMVVPLVAILAGLGLGMGMTISSMTTKYRDLQFLVSFGVQLLMYATPVVYPLSFISEKYRWVAMYNPLTSIIEGFRYIFLGAGSFSLLHLLYSFGCMCVILMLGAFAFNRTEQSFIDTV